MAHSVNIDALSPHEQSHGGQHPNDDQFDREPPGDHSGRILDQPKSPSNSVKAGGTHNCSTVIAGVKHEETNHHQKHSPAKELNEEEKSADSPFKCK